MSQANTSPLRAMLLHGIHMHAWAMLPLSHRLLSYGIHNQRFGYYSVAQTLPQHSRRLAEAVRYYYRHHQEPLHFICHSLGGLVLRRFAADHPELVRGRSVTLATPHLGSQAAERLYRLAPALIGGAYAAGLDGQLPPWPPQLELGCIAGNRNLGLGQLIGLRGEGDGTVLLSETRAENCRDYLILPVSHSAMLTDRTVAMQTAYFLRHGRFLRAESA
ncbi:acetyltransferase [Eikenella sp. S3360]|uniref:Acetyltransferase n=1 Tax=Eikenella glucosivorans TaxID=2766967 RepID=A0ABS0N8B4_9NEIS|nr:acetyltransferase [Eikenella glucosivorans]MBH5328542.1 acetyltransferase [Eikenella glucosivorans]